MTRSNAWIALEHSVAQAWKQWYVWLRDGQQGPEPALDEWDKKAIRKLVDIDFAYDAFKKAQAGGKTWHCLAVWDVTHQMIQSGYNHHGDANEGGNFECAGLWWWESGDGICQRDETFGWQPIQVLKFMPDECTAYDAQGDCTNYQPATELRAVQLVAGQPHLDFSEAA